MGEPRFNRVGSFGDRDYFLKKREERNKNLVLYPVGGNSEGNRKNSGKGKIAVPYIISLQNFNQFITFNDVQPC